MARHAPTLLDLLIMCQQRDGLECSLMFAPVLRKRASTIVRVYSVHSPDTRERRPDEIPA